MYDVVVDPDHARPRSGARSARPSRGRASTPRRRGRTPSRSRASIASSSDVDGRRSARTGPKISSRMIRISWVTPVSTAGAMKWPLKPGDLDRAAAAQRRAGRDRVVDQLARRVSNCSVGHHRADLGVPVQRVADAQRAAPSHDALDEAVGHLAHRRRRARSPSRSGRRSRSRPRRQPEIALVEVRVGADDLRVLAAELEHRALQPLRALLADPAADLDRAGEEDLGRARLDQRLADRAAAVHGPHESLGQARALEHAPGCAAPISGVSDAGFSTTPLPAISAIATSPNGIDHG